MVKVKVMDISTASIFEMVKDSRNITIGIKYEVTYMHLPYMNLTLPNSYGQGQGHADFDS